MSPLKEYFNKLSESLQADYVLAGQTPHRGDIGQNREDLLIKLLNNHLPERLKAVQGGSIIAPSGEVSGQLDIVVKNDLFPKFEHNKKSYVLVDSVAAVISVKSKLDKPKLVNVLDNLNTIPEFDPASLHLTQGAVIRKGIFEQFAQYYPIKVVFAWDSIEPRALARATSEYQEQYDLPPHRVVDLVIVNKRLAVSYTTNERTGNSDRVIPANSFFSTVITDEHLVGYPLSLLLVELNKYVQWMHYMWLEYDRYLEPAYIGSP